MKICRTCGSTDMAVRSALCKEHHREYVREHYQQNKQYYIDKARKRNIQTRLRNRETVIQWLRANPCVDCGNDDIEVLQFDHRDPEIKEANIAQMMTGSHGKLCAEILKCDIRCANCHTKKTRRQLGWWHEAVIEAVAIETGVEMPDPS